MAGTNAKFMTGLSPVMPVADAAAVVLRTRLNAVTKLFPRALRGKPGTEEGEKSIHVLRVSARRATAALGVFRPMLAKSEFEKARRSLRKIRRAAGAARDCDVQLGVLSRARASARQESERTAIRYLAARTRSLRKAAQEPLQRVLEDNPPARLKRRWEKLVEGIGKRTPKRSEFGPEARMIDAARGVLERETAAALKVAAGDLTNLDQVHALRIELKRLRYAMEVFGSCFGQQFRDRLYPELISLQECLGTVNDAYVLIERIKQEIAAKTAKPDPAIRRGLKALLAEQHETLHSAHAAFLETWKRFASGTFFEALRRELNADGAASGGGHVVRMVLFAQGQSPNGTGNFHAYDGAIVEPKPGALNGVSHTHPKPSKSAARSGRHRLAAVDVGTNSVRLIVAEAAPDGSYRILDDEKEITRLGRGLEKTGKMDPASIEHTAVTVARMKSIALGYGAEEIRVVGTSAAREAKNGAVLHRLLLEKAGLEMEVISGEEEAMLAYRSAARAFDLTGHSGLVVDIGGGSTEIVLSAATGVVGTDAQHRRTALNGGVIEGVYSVPIGAVRLTEKFGGPEMCSGERFDEMREYVKEMIKKRVGKAPMLPQIVIGTGGTLTTLAAMALHRELGASAEGLFGKVQGAEVSRAEIKHLLDYLRKLPIRERTRVPGLGADRADIIIAGLVIVDCVLKRFEANRLKVHEGGIRDGLLLSMVRRGGNSPAGGASATSNKPDPMKSVRRFAKDCGYEAAHAKHVTRLALQVFDQLAAQQGGLKAEPGMSFDAEARMLLEASSLLHDIGYLINYAQHHKHSYHLIVHADLAGLTTRQIHVIANVARYHRSAEPKAKHRTFSTLSEEDQGLIRGLAAILRVADGLDRTHMQNVRDLNVKLEKGAAHFGVRATDEPAVDIWGAVRKSGLFRGAFALLPHFEWTRSGVSSDAGAPIGSPRGSEVGV